MERYIVSARKYRPDTFDTVVGQGSVTDTLKNAIRNDHLAQAFLFTGPRGVGKTTCARILARTINCEDLREDLSTCGKCDPCRTFEEGHSLNIFELDAASNNSVDDIRNLILQVQIAPQVGVKKVYIIDEVHMLSQAAFNAFLKTLEEPPSYAIFILATTEKHKILPTILSRCQVFDFRRISVNDIAAHLSEIADKEGIDAEKQALHVIAQKADGGLRDALSIFDQLVSFSGSKLTYQDVVKNLNVLDHEHYFAITEALLAGDSAAALVEFHGILQQGFDGHLFIAGLGKHFRDLLVCQDPRTLPLLEVSEEVGTRYVEQAAKAPRDLLIRGLELIGQCDAQYKNAKEPRLLVELTLLQLSRTNGRTDTADDATVEKKKPRPELTRPSGEGSSPSTAERKGSSVPEDSIPSVPAEGTAEPPQANAGKVAAPDRNKRQFANRVSITQQLSDVQKRTEARPKEEKAIEDPGSDLPAATDSAREIPTTLLLKAWQDYALKQKREGRNSLHATLCANEPQIAGPRLVTFVIVNDVQEKYMREERPTLLGHLRRELDLPDLELQVVKEEITDLRPRYTPLDRFNILAEKNPALLKLRDALDLDLS